MPQGYALMALGGLVLLCLLLGVAFLRQSGDGGAINARLRALAGPGEVAQAKLVLPSIRVGKPTHGQLSIRLMRLVRFDPDMPQARSMPWSVVAVMAGLVGCAVFFMAAGRLGLPLGSAAAAGVAVMTARFLFGWQHRRYADAVFQQIPDTLGLMVRAIRAGLPLAEALRNVAREVPSPTREEFGRVAGEMAIGRPVEEALVSLSRRTGLSEYGFLAVTLGLQSQTGGSLAETLENLADIVRKRVAMAKRARALAAEANMQAGMLVVLPFLAAAAMSIIQPFYIAAFTENPTGQTMAMIGLVMMALGLVTIRWLIRQASQG